MAKKCKHCGAVVEDEISPCPMCDNIAFTELPKVELTREQFAELEKSVAEKLGKSSSLALQLTWRVALVIFTILGIPGAIVGWSIWSSLQSVEQTTNKDIQTKFATINASVSNRIENAHSAISNDVSLKFSVYAQDASNQLAEAHAFVTNQIAAEFQTPRIKQTVELVAKGEAKSILEAEVQPAVRSFKEDALFMRTIARAQGYDFKAYQALLEIGNGTNDNARLANQVITEIDRSLARDRSDFSPRHNFLMVSGTNFYGGPFTSDELALFFSSAEHDTTSFNREGFVNTVADLKQPLFLPSLVEFFTNETDLGVADRLTIAISGLAKEDFHPHDFSRITTWWNDKHDAYTNWPFAAFELGSKEFSSVNYPAAAAAFEQVLKLDSGADMSRAYAIACYWKTGETNRAAILAKEFKNPSARWAQWASAEAELESGSISNATVHFAYITTNFPTMLTLPNKGYDIYKKIDWQLFDNLVGKNAP